MFSHISASLLQLVLISYVDSLVLTTSNGFVIIPAIPPAIPAHVKYQNNGVFLSHGLDSVFKFSLTVTTTAVNGILSKTWTGRLRNKPVMPSSFKRVAIVY